MLLRPCAALLALATAALARRASHAPPASLLEGPEWRAARAAARPAAAALAAGLAAVSAGEAPRTHALANRDRWPKAWQEQLEPNFEYRFSPLGHEAFFTTRFRKTGTAARVKEVPVASTSAWSDARAEVDILRQVQGPCVVALYDAAAAKGWNGADTVFMLMESNDGDLYNKVVLKSTAVSFETKLQLFADLLHALARIADAGVVHREVTPRNLHIFGNCSEPLGCRLKVGCFGSSCTLDGGLRPCGAVRKVNPWPYVAPEVALDAPENPKRDVFGAALVFYAMVFGGLPVVDLASIHGNWAELRKEKPGLVRILDSMLAVNVSKRCTAAEALHELRRFAEEEGIHLVTDEED